MGGSSVPIGDISPQLTAKTQADPQNRQSKHRLESLLRSLRSVTLLVLAGIPAHSDNSLALDGVDACPRTISDFLRRGLVEAGNDNVAEWRECHRRLLESGVDSIKADLALGLILARAGRYDHMEDLLKRTHTREPESLVTLHLLSWARLSDAQILGGLEAASQLVRSSHQEGRRPTPVAATPQVEVASYAGKAFGFAGVVVRELKPDDQEQYQAIRKTTLSMLSSEEHSLFLSAEEIMQRAVADGLVDTLESKDHAGEQQSMKKATRRVELETAQAQLENEATTRREQAAAIEREAMRQLREIELRAEPLFSARGVINAELDRLHFQRSRQSDDFDRERYDPQIASAQGRLDGINQRLDPLIAQYRQIEQTAIRQIQLLGLRVQRLTATHRANITRLAENEREREDGLTGKLAGELTRRTRFSTYLPLDYERESRKIMAMRFSTSADLD